MAVNTVDNAVVTDLAVSWAIVTATRLEENNEAWALASCTDCVTKAVAYQVLLALPGAEVIAPVNAAVAANYECRRCLTEAIAVQLVVSVTDIPSAAAQVLIEQAMAKVEALEIHLKTLSAGQIYTILQASQLEIMKILDEDGKIPATAPPTTTPPAPAADSAAVIRSPAVPRHRDTGVLAAGGRSHRGSVARAVDVRGADSEEGGNRPRSGSHRVGRPQRARAADGRARAGALARAERGTHR